MWRGYLRVIIWLTRSHKVRQGLKCHTRSDKVWRGHLRVKQWLTRSHKVRQGLGTSQKVRQGVRRSHRDQTVTDNQGPRIVWRLGWGVEYSVSKCAVRVENQVLNKAYLQGWKLHLKMLSVRTDYVPRWTNRITYPSQLLQMIIFFSGWEWKIHSEPRGKEWKNNIHRVSFPTQIC